jgi:hypothetical protein
MNTPVSFELAKLLKEKGFSWECSQFYCKTKNDKKFYLTTGTEYESDRDCIWDWNLNGGKSGTLTKTIPYPNDTNAIYYSAPTISDVVMWLYEKHGFWCYVYTNGKLWYPCIQYSSLGDMAVLSGKIGLFNSPTEAYEAGIEYTLKNLI